MNVEAMMALESERRAKDAERRAVLLENEKQPALAFVQRSLASAYRLVARDLRGEEVTTI